MAVSDMVSAAEVVGGAAVFLMFLGRQVKTGTRDGWRDAAESHRERADALEKQIETLVGEVRALRVENEELRKEVAELRTENRELRDHIDRLIGGDEE
ncbi:cell division protein ZapB [Streptomyces sp. NPDC097610]|uniref:cell division protein ZapB n=1 Tax=Streptomyces sp. NPDC097610 TaxID=3157227 RepID=UPI00331E965B